MYELHVSFPFHGTFLSPAESDPAHWCLFLEIFVLGSMTLLNPGQPSISLASPSWSLTFSLPLLTLKIEPSYTRPCSWPFSLLPLPVILGASQQCLQLQSTREWNLTIKCMLLTQMSFLGSILGSCSTSKLHIRLSTPVLVPFPHSSADENPPFLPQWCQYH